MNWPRRVLNTAYISALAYVNRRIPFWPIERVERLQRRRLRSIAQHAYETVPFYHQAMDDRGLNPRDFQSAADLAKLPLIDDVTLRKHTDQFISTRYPKHSQWVIHTSGAHSHTRKAIYWDYASVLRILAYAERSRAVLNNLGGKGWGQRQLFIMPHMATVMDLRAFWDAQTLIPTGLVERHFYSPGPYLSFEEAVEQLNTIRPHIVFSFASYADVLFRYLAEHQPTVALPRVWVYGADMLSPGGQELMEEMFGCIVYSTYQAAETGRLGFQCERRQGFHLNIDLCAVRLVDEDGRTVKPGESGEVVTSNLQNRAMVLLNYRLGDCGVLASEPCSCGRSLPVLESLQGRISEIIYLTDGRRMRRTRLEYSFKDELAYALQARVVQSAPGEICWQIVPLPSADSEDIRRALLDKARTVLGADMQVTVEFLEDIPRAPGGKFLRIVSHRKGAEGAETKT
jgi:phenylacetate-CoA ligase